MQRGGDTVRESFETQREAIEAFTAATRRPAHPKLTRKFRTLLSQMVTTARKRAGLKGMDFDLTVAHVEDLFVQTEGRCELTGKDFDPAPAGADHFRAAWRPSIDRIDPKGGYTAGNVRLLSVWANNAVGQWGDQTFMEAIRGALAQGVGLPEPSPAG